MNIDLTSQLVSVPRGSLIISPIPWEQAAQDSLFLEQKIWFSLVVPTFNEARNIENLVRSLSTLLQSYLGADFELIVVDDNSPDRTWEKALELAPLYPHLRVMRRQAERGLSTAVIRGWQVARGEVLGVIDGDLQHPPETLLQLLQMMQDGADLAVASRHVEGGGVSNWSLARRFLSRGAQVLGLVIAPNVVGRVTDPMSGYFMVRRRAIADIALDPLGYKILLEVIGRGKVEQIAEVGYVFQDRVEGESKVSWQQYVDYILHLVKLRSRGRIGKLRQRFPIDRFLRFGVVGFSGVFVDLAIFYLLRFHFGFNIFRSTVLSAETAVISNFLLNDWWTFGDIARKQPGKRQMFKRFLKFNLICLMGITLQGLIVSLGHDFFKIHEMVSKLTAIALVTLWNFWINLKLSWRVTQVK